ncbi:hypothetical protein EDD17DRAFT_1753231 [Pisolithus thermaeus]|nr:hypothetical protein EDD17DRAFT_1753231 [Pisolithus thermaeus]
MAFTVEGLIFIVERVPTNSGMQVTSSNGGVARDTITVMRAREYHKYWRRAGQEPVCKGTLRWQQPSPHLFNIVFIASVASTVFRHYNLYVQQCYFYARITLDAVARAFPSCSREGSTSFLRGRLTILGSYKLSQVQLLVDLHAIGCQGVVPSIETERYASRLVTPDILRGLAMSISSLQRFLALLISLEPGRDVAIRHSDHTSGEVPQPGPFMGSRQLDDNREDGPEVRAS